MKRTALALFVMTLISSLYSFAVDGQVLINQSTVMAAGGFPYHITQPGSYKLTGNLTPPRNKLAIYITSDNVVLDLNGFTLSCSFQIDSSFAYTCITADAESVIIRNGVVTAREDGPATNSIGGYIAVALAQHRHVVEDLIVDVTARSPSIYALAGGFENTIRHNILITPFELGYGAYITCPGVVVENQTSYIRFDESVSPCAKSNNTSYVGIP